MIRALRIFLLLLAAVAVVPVRAVTVSSGGSAITNADETAAPWSYVGVVNGCSAVYLGSYGGKGWVLTASHVGVGNITIGGVTYYYLDGTVVQLTNASGSSADLILYAIDIDEAIDWSLLTISSQTLAAGTSVTMIGNGGGTMRGGTNTVEPGWVWAGVTGSSLVTRCLYTDWDSGEAQAITRDSGGAVFSQDSTGNWSLSGIMLYVSSSGTASTYFADLSYYRSQILAAIPEPAAAAVWSGLAVLGVAVVVRCRRRR